MLSNAKILSESKVWNEEIVSELLVTAEALLEMLNNSLDMSKLEEGRVEFNKCFESIYKVVDMVVNMSNANAKKKGVKLSSSYSRIMPELIQIDRCRLTQVIMNLVSNAVKFTPKDRKVEVRTKWLWRCAEQGGDCQACDHALPSAPNMLSKAEEEKTPRKAKLRSLDHILRKPAQPFV